MMIRNIIFMLVLFPVQVVSMETKHTVGTDVQNMLSICAERCTFMGDVTGGCTNKCFMEYSKQKNHFLVRKYTQQCLGLPFEEKWSFKETDVEACEAARNTIAAYKEWKNSAVRDCANGYMIKDSQLIKGLEQEGKKKIAQFHKEHPILSAAVDARQLIRHGKR
jgi:hypothetical protein